MTAYSTCRSCHAQILWAVTATDRRIPLDVDPRPDGNIAKNGVYDPAGAPHVTILTGGAIERARADRKELYVAHFVTCTDQRWRR